MGYNHQLNANLVLCVYCIHSLSQRLILLLLIPFSFLIYDLLVLQLQTLPPTPKQSTKKNNKNNNRLNNNY